MAPIVTQTVRPVAHGAQACGPLRGAGRGPPRASLRGAGRGPSPAAGGISSGGGASPHAAVTTTIPLGTCLERRSGGAEAPLGYVRGMSLPMRALIPSLGAIMMSAAVASCSKTPTTPAGRLGAVDLSSTLPGGVVAPATLDSYETKQTICGVDNYAGAIVNVQWKAFKRGKDAYVTWYAVDVVTPAEALELTLDTKPEQFSALDAPEGGFMGMPMVKIDCSRKMFRLSQSDKGFLQIKADGTSPAPKMVKVK